MQAHDTAAWGGSDWKRADLEEYWGELDLGHDAWVVELEDRIAGYVDFEARPAGRLLADGYVAPDTRGGGVGSALVAHALAQAAGRRVRVGTGARNAPALALYERYGFRRLDEGSPTPSRGYVELVREP